MTENYQPRNGRNKYLPRKVSTKVDFTPFVDMTMLLITFFMLATTMNKEESMKLAMPADDPNPPPTAASKVVTLYLGKDHQVYYFHGEPDILKQDFLLQTNFKEDGLRKILLEKNRNAVTQIVHLTQQKQQSAMSDSVYEERVRKLKENSTIVIIKPLDTSTYNDMVSALDEMLITNIGRYMIAKLNDYDKTILENSKVEY